MVSYFNEYLHVVDQFEILKYFSVFKYYATNDKNLIPNYG